MPEMMSQRGCEADVDVNLNEIDDKEFDIPQIDQQPTLESILSLPDDEQSIIDSEVSFAAEFPRPGHAPFVHPVCFDIVVVVIFVVICLLVFCQNIPTVENQYQSVTR